MSEIKYYDNGAMTPDAVFHAAMEENSPYAARADRSHEADADILTGVSVTTGYASIAAANSEPGSGTALTTATLAANTNRFVKVAIPSGADSAALRNIMRTAGAKLGAAAAAIEAAAIKGTTGIITLTLNLSRSDVFTCLIDVKTAMDERGCPKDGRVLIVPAALFGELAKDNKVLNETDIEVTGDLIRVMGFEIHQDEGLDGEMIAFHRDAVSVAQIVTAYSRTASLLSAKVSAGAVVLIPGHVAAVTVS